MPPRTGQTASIAEAIEIGDRLRDAGDIHQAVEAYLSAARATEVPCAEVCLRLGRSYRLLGNYTEARSWALAVVDAGDDFTHWQAAAALARRCEIGAGLPNLRSARLALLGSYTTAQYKEMLRLAALRLGVALEIYEANYNQYRQEVIDAESRMYEFAPDFILLAVHEGELALPDYSEAPRQEVTRELRRWVELWQTARLRSRARVIQHNFATPCEAPMGHLGGRLVGSRYRMTQALNAELGDEASDAVLVIDCEHLSSLHGKRRWFDPRYWHLAKQAVALEALPLLARHTAAVIAGDLGLSRKCLVFDLDNTIWGGVVGEDGLAGIRLGQSAEGEAFVAFQEYILKLKNRGVILAVCSKNNEADAKEPFEKHPEMRIKLDDISMFVANWDGKPDGIRAIAAGLDIGLDSIVFVDDNPVERLAIRQALPEVDVITLPADPSQYARALSEYTLFETSSFTPEDSKRTQQYQARARVAELGRAAHTIEDFYDSLKMEAVVAPFDEFHLPRIAQLINKTNQFNLTTRRHSLAQLRAMMADPQCVHLSLRLRDRFTDHGLVAIIIAFIQGDLLNIDSWLMSCRVIGRTVEAEMLEHLCRRAEQLGCGSLCGTYIATPKNALASEVFARHGFDLLKANDLTTTWVYDIRAKGAIRNRFIQAVEEWGAGNDIARAAGNTIPERIR